MRAFVSHSIVQHLRWLRSGKSRFILESILCYTHIDPPRCILHSSCPLALLMMYTTPFSDPCHLPHILFSLLLTSSHHVALVPNCHMSLHSQINWQTFTHLLQLQSNWSTPRANSAPIPSLSAANAHPNPNMTPQTSNQNVGAQSTNPLSNVSNPLSNPANSHPNPFISILNAIASLATSSTAHPNVFAPLSSSSSSSPSSSSPPSSRTAQSAAPTSLSQSPTGKTTRAQPVTTCHWSARKLAGKAQHPLHSSTTQSLCSVGQSHPLTHASIGQRSLAGTLSNQNSALMNRPLKTQPIIANINTNAIYLPSSSSSPLSPTYSSQVSVRPLSPKQHHSSESHTRSKTTRPSRIGQSQIGVKPTNGPSATSWARDTAEFGLKNMDIEPVYWYYLDEQGEQCRV